MAQAIYPPSTSAMENIAQQQLMLQRPSLSKMSEIDRQIAAILSKKDMTADERKEQYNKLLKEFFAARDDVLINGTQLKSPIMNVDEIQQPQEEIIKPVILATEKDLNVEPAKRKKITAKRTLSEPEGEQENMKNLFQNTIKNTFLTYDTESRKYINNETQEDVSKDVQSILRKISNPNSNVKLTKPSIHIIKRLVPLLEQQSILYKSLKTINNDIDRKFVFDSINNPMAIVAEKFHTSENLRPETEKAVVDLESWDNSRQNSMQNSPRAKTRSRTIAARKRNQEAESNLQNQLAAAAASALQQLPQPPQPRRGRKIKKTENDQ